MKHIDIQKKRKRAATAIAIVLVLALVLSALAPLLYAVQAQAMTLREPAADVAIDIMDEQDSNLAPEMGLNHYTLKLSIGDEQEYTVGTDMPIKGSISNQSEDFEGEFCIKVYDYSNGNIPPSYSEYYQKLSLKKDETKQIDVVVSMGSSVKSLQFTLKDTSANVVYLKNIPIKALPPATDIVVDEASDTMYINGKDEESIESQLFWMSDSFEFMDENSLVGIFAVVAIYILLVGPLLYFYLKRKNKREFGWIAIPAIAVIFTVAIFVMAMGSNYQKGMINTVSVTDMPKTGEEAIVYLAGTVKSPKGGEIILELEDSLQNLNFGDDRRYGGRNRQEDMPQRRILMEENKGIAISFMDMEKWGSSNFTGNMTQDLGGGFESTMKYQGNGKLFGKLINNSNMDFNDILISVNGEFFRYDGLLAGEELEVDVQLDNQNSENTNFDNKVYSAFGMKGRERYGVQELINEGSLTRSEGFVLLQKIDMITGIFDVNSLNGDEGMIINVYAFNEEPVLQGETLINGKKPIASHLGMYRCSFTEKWSEMDRFFIPYGVIIPTVDAKEEHEIFSDTRFYSDVASEIKVKFSLPKNVSLNSFTIANNGDISGFTTEPMIYNFETQRFEPLSFNEYTNTEAYIGDEKFILLQLAVEEKFEIELPSITMKGVGNNAGN